MKIEQAKWSQQQDELTSIRRRVFIEEQQVPEELEWDGLDETAIHLLARADSGRPIATLRLLPDGHIGRMAVLPDYRRQGIGRALMLAIEELARRQGLTELFLHAQIQALGFYRSLGYQAEGEEFMDAGIPHLGMRKRLAGQ